MNCANLARHLAHHQPNRTLQLKKPEGILPSGPPVKSQYLPRRYSRFGQVGLAPLDLCESCKASSSSQLNRGSRKVHTMGTDRLARAGPAGHSWRAQVVWHIHAIVGKTTRVICEQVRIGDQLISHFYGKWIENSDPAPVCSMSSHDKALGNRASSK